MPTAHDRLTRDQRDTLRETADTLVLAQAHDPDVVAALAAARAVLLNARRGKPEPWIEQLADDLEDAGPEPNGVLSLVIKQAYPRRVEAERPTWR